ncbi:MAG: peptidyl-prolyl cis-trans isomerase [Fibrobacterota bacterium]
MGKKSILVLLLLIIIGGLAFFYFTDFRYGRTRPHGPVVAKVGNAVLTLQELQKRIPAEYSDFVTYEQNVDYVKRWIDAEILYQTALAEKLDQAPAIRERLNKVRKDILMSEMVSRLCAQSPDVSEADIEKYYQQNGSRYTRKETEIKFIHINVRSMAEAWKIRNQVTPDNFSELAKQFSLDPQEDIDNLSYVTRNQVMPELAEVIFDIKIGGTTPAIKTPAGWYIVKIIDKQVEGSVRPLASVRDEIINHVSSQTQKVHLDELIAGLRKKFVVEYNLSLIPGKSEPTANAPSEPAAALVSDTAQAAPAPKDRPAADTGLNIED